MTFKCIYIKISNQMERMNFEPDRHIETAPELQEARLVIQAAIVGNTPPATPEEQLERLELILEEAPQLDSRGAPQYLLTSGLAVELITGYKRPHHDVDLVIMNPDESQRWEIWGTDNVTPGRYWADMEFEPEFLAETRVVTRTRKRKSAPFVGCVNPAIMLVQKLSDCFGRAPRQKDQDDAAALRDYLADHSSREWLGIAEEALRALPGDQTEKTVKRIEQLLTGVGRVALHT